MRRFLLTAVLVVLALLGCGPANALSPLGPNTSITSFSWGQPSDIPLSTLIASMSRYGNVMEGNDVADLAAMAAVHQRALTLPDDVIFEPGSYSLQANWQANFDAWYASFQPYERLIYAVYLADGPYWNNYGAAVPQDPHLIRDNANTVADYIHQKAPGVLVFWYDAWPDFFLATNSMFSTTPFNYWTDGFPTHVDAMAVNCYPSDDANVCTEQFRDYLQQQLLQHKGGQWVTMVLDAWYTFTVPTPTPDPSVDAEHFAEFLQVRRQVMNSPDISAAGVFLWTPTGDCRASGCLPNTQAAMQLYYLGLRGWAHCVGTTAVIRYSSVYGPNVANSPSCQPQQEGTSLVTRDLDGSVVLNVANAFPLPPPTGSIAVAGTPIKGVPLGVVLTSEYADTAAFSFDNINFSNLPSPNMVGSLTPNDNATIYIRFSGAGGPPFTVTWQMNVQSPPTPTMTSAGKLRVPYELPKVTSPFRRQ